MEDLQAAYGYDENNDASEVPTSPPLIAAAVSTPDVVEGMKPELPEIDRVNVIKEEIGTAASKDGLSEEASSNRITKVLDPHQIKKRDSENSPNLAPETDAGEKVEEGEEEEEPPVKKQKQLPDLPKETAPEREITEMPPPTDRIPPQHRSGKPPAGKSKKKKSKDVWATTSRRGKKKSRHASNYNRRSDKMIPLTGDKVIFSSVLHYPERDDDSPDLNICLSKIFKTEKVVLSEDRLTASSTKGYRMVRTTRGVTDGAWYFEIKVVHLGGTGHTRLGWSTEKGDLQAPVGFDSHSYGYRDIDGCKLHKALREKYGDEGYKEGDVIGFYINLPDGGSYLPNPQDLVLPKGKDPPNIVPGSEISYFKNGVCQGVAFRDIFAGCYYPAASMYTLPNQPPCVVTFNFGPGFERFPEDFGEHPIPRPMIEVPYQNDCRVENGGPWHITRIFPMLKVIKGGK